MQVSGNWLLIQSLVKTVLYKLLRLVFIPVQRIYWQLNGTARKLREARLPENYERSAQVLDVVLFHKFCMLANITTVENFLCTHNRFENPQYIVDNENITLMTINEQDAVFCETEDKGKPVDTHTFMQVVISRRFVEFGLTLSRLQSLYTCISDDADGPRYAASRKI